MKNIITSRPSPLTGSGFINLVKLFRENKVDKGHIFQALYISLISLSVSPFRIYDKIKFNSKINEQNIEYPPIFIIGHWRSGTTYLHRLMSLNKNLGYMTSFQAVNPEIFLSFEKIFKFVCTPLWPSKRFMDNMSYSQNCPEEEEYALGNISNCSWVHSYSFPTNMLNYFNKYILFEGLHEQEVKEIKDKYMEIAKRLILYNGQKVLVFKNPPNTARIKILLELFPKAKFIHIYRNPYLVFYSTKNLCNKLLLHWSFHDVDEKQIESNIFIIYRKLMSAFFETKHLIPAENLIEIRYEDFIGNEIEFLKSIYEQFNIFNCETSENKIKKYLTLNSSYQKNKYSFDKETLEKIDKNWQFTIDTWNYSI